VAVPPADRTRRTTYPGHWAVLPATKAWKKASADAVSHSPSSAQADDQSLFIEACRLLTNLALTNEERHRRATELAAPAVEIAAEIAYVPQVDGLDGRLDRNTATKVTL
jgi:hypothetical protein